MKKLNESEFATSVNRDSPSNTKNGTQEHNGHYVQTDTRKPAPSLRYVMNSSAPIPPQYLKCGPIRISVLAHAHCKQTHTPVVYLWFIKVSA